jgi:hypothetical protein
VVMREKNSPNAAPCSSRKVINMGTWCLGVQMGYHAPPPRGGGDKYDGLNLQVGGWETGQQPVTVTKLLGNLNCEEEKVHIGL